LPTTTRPTQDTASAVGRDGLMNLWICLFAIPVPLMVEENQKLPEPSDMELGSDINAGQFCGAPPEVLGRRLHHVMQK